MFGFFLVVFAIDAKDFLKVLALSWRFVRESTVGALEAGVFRETENLIAFRVILVLFQVVSKYLS